MANLLNKCDKHHKFKVEPILDNILKKVPATYLDNLDIILIDNADVNVSSKFIRGKGRESDRIELNMDSKELCSFSLTRTILFNFLFITELNKHIKNMDPFVSTSVDFEWMYFGKWNFLLYILKLIKYLIGKNNIFKSLFLKMANLYVYISGKVIDIIVK